MKPRVRLIQKHYSGLKYYVCSGWLPNCYQSLSTPGRTIEEAARMWFQIRDIYSGVPL